MISPCLKPVNRDGLLSAFATRWFIAAAILPWLITSYLLLSYVVNAPRLDDFEALLHWYQQYSTASSRQEQLTLLLGDYQNHRYALLRLPLLITDKINFAYYAYLSPLLLLVLLATLACALRQHPLRWPLLALASLCLCNLQLWPAAVWAPLGSANILFVAVALCSCVLVWSRFAALGWLLAALLCISHGSGPLLLLALGIGKSVYQKTAWQHWLFIMAVLLLYFVVFPTQSEAGYSSITSGSLLKLIIDKLAQWPLACLQLLGSVLMLNAVNDTLFLSLSALIGALFCALFCWSLRAACWRNQPVVLCWLLFLALTIASIAAGRALTINSAQMLQGHYKLLSNIGLWLALASAMLLGAKYRLQLAITITLALAVAVYIAGIIISLPHLKNTQQAYWQDSCQFIAQLQQSQPAKLQHPATTLFVKQPNKKLKTAYDSGFYRPQCD